jgi:uncharacterized membrane protein YqjE
MNMVDAAHLRALAESLQELVVGHIRLFKVELAEDARVIGVQVAKIAAFAPLLFVGYAFLCLALALFLRRFMAFDAACLTVGVLNLAVGGAGIALAALKLKEKRVLDGSMQELEASRSAIVSAVARKPEVQRG